MTIGIEPTPDATATSIDQWWYQKAGQSEGPISKDDIQQLIAAGDLRPDDMVWNEDFGTEWKAASAAGFEAMLSGPPPVTPPEPAPTYNARWQKIFDAVAAEEDHATKGNRTAAERMKANWKLLSLPGLIFGPFYYFYLKMWRRGLLLLALVPIIGVVYDLLDAPRFLNSLISVICMVLAKRDYYRFVVKGEQVWPVCRFSKNIWTDLALVGGVSIVCIGFLVFLEDDNPHATSRQTRSVNITVQKSPDFKVSSDSYNLTITSKTDNIRIDSVTANRGSCRVIAFSPQRLLFGQTAEAYALCNPIEIQVDTDQGQASFSWPR